MKEKSFEEEKTPVVPVVKKEVNFVEPKIILDNHPINTMTNKLNRRKPRRKNIKEYTASNREKSR